MQDIQLIRLLDVLDVNRIRNAPGVVPRSIIVDGRDFRHVESVIVDGMLSPSFVVMSTTQLVAEVPEAIRDSVLRSVLVLSTGVTLTERSIVEFTLGVRPRSLSGVQKLMQNFLRQLLRTPGSNIFHPRSGGGLGRRVGGLINNQTAADVAIAVTRARQYIINVQSAERAIPPSERLLSAEIAGLEADPKTTSIHVTIMLTSHAGQNAAATLVA